MQTIWTLPETTFPPGTYPFGPVAAAGNLSALLVQWDATYWTDPAVFVEIAIEESRDNGLNWQSACGATGQGGQIDKATGLPLTVGWATLRYEPALPAPVQLRGTVTIRGGGLKTSASLSVE